MAENKQSTPTKMKNSDENPASEANADQGAFKLGDLVWAKLSSFAPWPGRIVKPWKHVKKPQGKKSQFFVYFYGTEDHAWVKEDNLKHYAEHKEAMSKAHKGVKFNKAITAIEEAITEEKEKNKVSKAATVSPYHPEDDDEIFPPKSKPMKDYSREPLSGGGKLKLRLQSDEKDNKRKHKEVEKEEDSDPENEREFRSTPRKRGRGGRPPKTSTDGTSAAPRPFATPKKRATTGTGTHTPGRKSKAESLSYLALSLYNSYQKHLPDNEEKPEIKATEKKIGFIGLGIMGTGMAMNLIKAGHKVTVWNRTASKCEDFVKAGASQAESVSDLVKQTDIVISMLSDSEALRAVVFGENGILDAMQADKAFVDMTTVDIGTITGVSEAITGKDGRFLEAPLVGSVQQAMEGSLVVLGAGDKTLYDDLQSCFEALGKKSFYLGDVGNGARMKLINNMITGSMMCCFGEGMSLAEKAGLNQSNLLDILNLSMLSSPLIAGKGRAILAGVFPPAFPLKFQQKDMRQALSLAEQVDQPLPITAAVNEVGISKT
ncbi:cytokine-like nuclear factor N-PAC isoform X1 [Amphiura filiformis]|uniref:cytokine-like nuclear factor N-PAC isoform X1 n=1 Tax=Amphiura filiformis TaxID=82378 RepID=UPI003B216CE5